MQIITHHYDKTIYNGNPLNERINKENNERSATSSQKRWCIATRTSFIQRTLPLPSVKYRETKNSLILTFALKEGSPNYGSRSSFIRPADAFLFTEINYGNLRIMLIMPRSAGAFTWTLLFYRIRIED